MRSASLGVADDGAAGSLLEREIAAGMVVVMMGVEDMGERPALGLEASSTGSDTAGSTAATAPETGSRSEIDVIVLEDRNLLDLKRRHTENFLTAARNRGGYINAGLAGWSRIFLLPARRVYLID